MKRNTRQKILDAARELFNERGYNGVSLQDIADYVGISKGNLTYHFNRKESIMEALLSENKEICLEISQTLEELDKVFVHLQQMVQENSYYFMHHAQLSQISSDILDKQELVYIENTQRFHQTFLNLQELGLLRKEEFEGEYETIIDTLHMASIYWGSFSKLKKFNDNCGNYREYAWKLMNHLLTKKGRKEFSKIQDILI